MNKSRILLVEDEKVVAADIEECVKGLGYDVVGSAATGAEALRLAVNASPDLVLMDIKLKGILDGIDVAGALYDQLKIPVVYLTAHADAEILERAKRTAPSGYVLKPFDDRTLRTAIELAFDRHGRERQLIEGGERLTAAIGSIDEGVIVTQASGRITVMNRVAEGLTGWTQEEALGKPLGDVFVTLDAVTLALQPSPIGRVLREGLSVGLGDKTLLRGRHGTSTPIQGSAAPMRDGDTEAVGVCLLFRAANQRSADENWGAPDHLLTSRLEILGRLTEGVAQKFTSLLKTSRGRERAAQLSHRLLVFAQHPPAPAGNLDLNQLVAGLEDLLRCALGCGIELRTVLATSTGTVKAEPGQIELLLMNLALAAHDSATGGSFSIETSAIPSEGHDDGYAMLTVTPRDTRRNPATDLPRLDEIVRQAAGEIRVSSEQGVVKIYLPK